MAGRDEYVVLVATGEVVAAVVIWNVGIGVETTDVVSTGCGLVEVGTGVTSLTKVTFAVVDSSPG
jgi:hypothetical protein